MNRIIIARLPALFRKDKAIVINRRHMTILTTLVRPGFAVFTGEPFRERAIDQHAAGHLHILDNAPHHRIVTTGAKRAVLLQRQIGIARRLDVGTGNIVERAEKYIVSWLWAQ